MAKSIKKIVRPRGRQSRYIPEYLRIIPALYRDGKNDAEVAKILGVVRKTIFNWIAENPELREARQISKEAADARVEASLYQRACGYPIVEKTYRAKEGGGVELEKMVEKEVVPDVVAQIFWLKNRAKDKWRDVQRTEITQPEGPLMIINTLENPVEDYTGRGENPVLVKRLSAGKFRELTGSDDVSSVVDAANSIIDEVSEET